MSTQYQKISEPNNVSLLLYVNQNDSWDGKHGLKMWTSVVGWLQPAAEHCCLLSPLSHSGTGERIGRAKARKLMVWDYDSIIGEEKQQQQNKDNNSSPPTRKPMPSQAPSNSHLRSQKNKSHFPLLRLFAEYGCPVSALSWSPVSLQRTCRGQSVQTLFSHGQNTGVL